MHLRTLNRERAELAAEVWLTGRRKDLKRDEDEEGKSKSGGGFLFGRLRRRRESKPSSSPPAPSPEDIAEAEPLLFPARPGNGLLPLRFSRLEEAGVTSKEELDDALRRCSEGDDRFLLVRVAAAAKATKEKKGIPGSSSLRLVLRSDASSSDALVGVLAAAHARAELLEEQQQQQQLQQQQQQGERSEKRSSSGAEGEEKQQQLLLLSRATAAARRDVPAFYEALEDAGWQVEPFLLSPRERGGLVVLG